MQTTLLIATIIVSIVITALILLQGRGAGLGSAWGGGGEGFQTRRGLEKITIRATAVLIGIFLLLSLVNFIVI
jgi:protein translocase SecG subunit